MPVIILVGPWERCISDGIDQYINYVHSLRDEITNLKVIFSSMDPPGIIPDGIFDCVLSNNIPDNLYYTKFAPNFTAKLYAINSYLGTQLCEGDTIIRVRSDLKIKNLQLVNLLLDTVERDPNQLIIDYTESHYNILPFNFSDFLVVGKYNKLLSLFNVPLKTPSISKISLHPFTSHIAGFTRGIMTNEQLLWYSYFCRERKISRKVDSVINIFSSYFFLRKKFILINRELIFNYHEKYNKFDNSSLINFSSPSKISAKITLFNIVGGFYKYYYRSMKRIIEKVIN